MSGDPCTPTGTANACSVYTKTCSADKTSFTCTAANAPDGTACGTNQVCAAGSCVARTRTVSGAFASISIADDGTRTTTAAPQARGSTVQALVPDASAATKYKTIAGTLNADGTFSIPSVPAGHYYLQYPLSGTTVGLVELSKDTPDMSWTTARRPDLADARKTTNVTFDVTGLDPWTAGAGSSTSDLLQVSSSQADFTMRPFAQRGAAPSAGATSATVTVDWGTYAFPPFECCEAGLPDASKKDVVWFHQSKHQTFTPVTSGGVPASGRVASKYAKVTDLTIADGQPQTKAVALVPVTGTATAPVKILYSQFEALAPAVNPGSGGGGMFLGIYAIPHTIAFPDEPAGSPAQQLLGFFGNIPSTGTPPDTDYGTISYGTYLDATWSPFRQFSYSWSMSVAVPGGGAPVQWSGGYFAFDPASVTGDIHPTLSPVRAPQINGKDAFTAQPAVGAQPTFNWTAPATGTPSSYYLNIYDAAGNSVVSAHLYSTTFTVPPGVLVGGTTYLAVITANYAPWDAIDAPPLRFGVPSASMECVTAGFTP